MNELAPNIHILNPRARAEWEQRRASDPDVSAFVAASAGSGKTKLLTDRLLRLMLAGALPERIQCLTFTKAAAAEMAVRLQTRLGEWVTLDDPELDARLRELQIEPAAENRERARALFARVLDLPGGMRIGTIHAFCQSLLRRFPLEAALSPHFRLLDETDAGFALEEARETVLSDPLRLESALETAAALLPAQGFGTLLERLEACRARLRPLFALSPERRAAAVARAAGLRAESERAIIAGAAAWPGEADLRTSLALIARDGSPAVREKAQRMLGWLGLDAEDRAEHWDRWCDELLTGSGSPRALGAFANPKLVEKEPWLRDAILAEQNRIADIADQCGTLRMVQATRALLDLAHPMLDAFASTKENEGRLAYDDLIERTSALLVDPGAAWVLYKLDGGIDHLLLDEVQDTAAAQWRIADALTAEFFAGSGARDTRRTFFAVGDPKQSIYSFQGADPEAFDHWREHLKRRVDAAGEEWRDVPLDVSFRSTAPVLGLVDAVFRDASAAAGVVLPGQKLEHFANRKNHAGAVELWPLVPGEAMPEPEPWSVPSENLNRRSAPQRLAEALATWIQRQTDGTTMLESQGRPLAPGDVLVLVRRRTAFQRALVRALKSRNVPVAGLDRMMLTEQPAVQDLLALCEVLLLPQDDLSLACVLTSPLGLLDDDSLMPLAAGRTGSLWDALRTRAGERADWGRAARFLETLLARVDYATPHALLTEALGGLGGRARLFARLGPEAAEPVDELLGLALRYAAEHPPSLQGFLHWVRRAASEIKREPEGAGDVVRIMTVHGAKGLQAPLVILPDTTGLPKEDEARLAWAKDGEVELPLWAPRKELRCTACSSLLAEAQARQMAEYNRLLYVALTRAEDRLLVCGWQPAKEMKETSWYSAVEKGFAALGAKTAPFDAVPDAWDGLRHHLSTPQSTEPDRKPRRAAAGSTVPLPAWVGHAPLWSATPPPPEPVLPRPLAPSRPEGADLGPIPRTASPASSEQRFRRGRVVHALLQHLPELPAGRRAEAARAYAGRPGHAIPPDHVDALVAETLAILEHPELAPLFGPESRAELALSGVVGTQVITGQVDRLAILPDRVLLADFKTNRDPPARLEDTPVLYLRQLAAYRAILAGLYPGRAIHTFLVWTQGAQVSALPGALLDPHAPGATA